LEHAELPGQTMARIYEIYGITPPAPRPALPAAEVTTLTLEADPPSQTSQKSPPAPVEVACPSENSEEKHASA
jgi:hypothetical protein